MSTEQENSAAVGPSALSAGLGVDDLGTNAESQLNAVAQSKPTLPHLVTLYPGRLIAQGQMQHSEWIRQPSQQSTLLPTLVVEDSNQALPAKSSE